jgi:hypothetical protein
MMVDSRGRQRLYGRPRGRSRFNLMRNKNNQGDRDIASAESSNITGTELFVDGGFAQV